MHNIEQSARYFMGLFPFLKYEWLPEVVYKTKWAIIPSLTASERLMKKVYCNHH